MSDYIKLPRRHRPNSLYRKCYPGVDLPRWFIDSVRAIDENLYPVFHRYRYLWEDVMTASSGSTVEPRYCIKASGNDLDWGWILTDGEENPLPENKWHLWRWCGDWGIAHVINIPSTDPDHLIKVVNRLKRQAFLSNMSRKARMAFLQAEQEEDMLKKQAAADSRFKDTGNENKSLLKRSRRTSIVGS